MHWLQRKIQPRVAQLLASNGWLKSKRLLAALPGKLLSRRAKVEIFLALDDPYSYLLLQFLNRWLERAQTSPDLEFSYYLINRRDLAYYPQVGLWDEYARKDAALLAAKLGLNFIDAPGGNPPQSFTQPDSDQFNLFWYQQLALAPQSATAWLEVFAQYWHTKSTPLTTPNTADEILSPERNQISRWLNKNFERLTLHKQYLSALIWFEGEAWRGIDRFYHFEQRLFSQKLIASVQDPATSLREFKWQSSVHRDQPLEIFFSARSPYSYLGLMKAIKLCQQHQIALKIRPVLPMLMRGLKVPANKKWYIFKDTIREAKAAGIKYGRVADPLGVAVEYCYAIFEYALTKDKAIDWMQAFSVAVNAEGIDASEAKGLQLICARAGLNWTEAKPWLKRNEWRQRCEQNQRELASLGHWGVPCFRYGKLVFWGQDRLWLLGEPALQEEL